MKTLAPFAIALTATTLSLANQPAPADAFTFNNQTLTTTKATPPQLIAAKEGLSYPELFDLGERFVDTIVYAMMDSDHSMLEFLFDIGTVKISSDGQFATVIWSYDRSYGGIALLEQQGDYISILTERSEALPQSSLESMGIPAAAAAEIAID